MITQYTITDAMGDSHTGYVQGSGGRLRGEHGLKALRLAAAGRDVNIYDPTQKPPYSTARGPITNVAVYRDDDDRNPRVVNIQGATIEGVTS